MNNVNIRRPLEIHPQAGTLLASLVQHMQNFRPPGGYIACGPMWCSPMTLWHCGTFCSLIYTALQKLGPRLVPPHACPEELGVEEYGTDRDTRERIPNHTHRIYKIVTNVLRSGGRPVLCTHLSIQLPNGESEIVGTCPATSTNDLSDVSRASAAAAPGWELSGRCACCAG